MELNPNLWEVSGSDVSCRLKICVVDSIGVIMACPLCAETKYLMLRRDEIKTLSELWLRQFGFDPFHGGGIKHFAPKVRIVTGRVTVGKDVRVVGAAVARRHGGEIQAVLLQHGGLEGDHVVGCGDFMGF